MAFSKNNSLKAFKVVKKALTIDDPVVEVIANKRGRP
jgi:hypothetical protein